MRVCSDRDLIEKYHFTGCSNLDSLLPADILFLVIPGANTASNSARKLGISDRQWAIDMTGIFIMMMIKRQKDCLIGHKAFSWWEIGEERCK
jgi:hypothetical protein